MTHCTHHEALRRAVELVVSKTSSPSTNTVTNPAVLLCGAGISTSSSNGLTAGLPDYRSPTTGLYNRGHVPITLQQFLSTNHQQRRYFARSFLGYKKMQNASCNINHFTIANLMQQRNHKFIGHCITQNVDGLNAAAFFERDDLVPSLASPTPKRMMKSDSRAEKYITELHGSIHYVVCMKCNAREHRQHLQNRMSISNANWYKNLSPAKLQDDDENTPKTANDDYDGNITEVKNSGSSSNPEAAATSKARPDGDFFLTDDDVQGFNLPNCLECGGIIRPHVVLFGDNIPPATKQRAHQIADQAPVLITAGTSLQVPSAFAFARKFLLEKKPVVIFNEGPTRLTEEMAAKKLKFPYDPKLVVTIEGKLEQTLGQFAASLPN